VVDSKRQAETVHYYILKAYAPVKVELANPSFADGNLVASVKVSNLYNFINLDGSNSNGSLKKEAIGASVMAATCRTRNKFSSPCHSKPPRARTGCASPV